MKKGYQMSWHNTTDEEQLDELNEKAEKQEDVILEFFRKNRNKEFTPFAVHTHVLLGCPITSIRRAITNLTKEGKLIKTDKKIVEEYGVSNYLWKYNTKYE